MTLPSIKDAEPAEPKPPGPLTVADLRRHVAEREASGERSHAGWQVDLAPKAAWEIRHDPEYQVCVCGGQRPLPGDFFACVHGMYLRANARVSALTVAEIQPMQERRFGDGRELQHPCGAGPDRCSRLDETDHAKRQLACPNWELRGDILFLAVPLA